MKISAKVWRGNNTNENTIKKRFYNISDFEQTNVMDNLILSRDLIRGMSETQSNI